MINHTWQNFIKTEENKEYYKNLQSFIDNEYSNHTVYPKKDSIFKALELTPFEKVKVVILGQDPYHNVNQAMGLSFSVSEGEKLPPSLKNIFHEMETDLNIKMNNNGDLTYLATQGVLLLNTVLTVREHIPNSHKNHGWEIFTDNIIKLLNTSAESIVFILWGNNAISKKKLISDHHYILESVHPSPLSARRGFFGSKPFSKTNEILSYLNKTPINWQN